ncbi:MAG: hypothetical protein JWO36_6706 [Myxococcales bacterium]|nr:hypothetical protein [Myxococcales bacterium]
MLRWARRAAALHDELAAVADLGAADPRWWVVAGGAALPWHERGTYVASDAEPSADTFIGHRADPPADVMAHAIARAHAARFALRELDGKLPHQPLAVTLRRDRDGAVTEPSQLEVAALAIGDRVSLVRLRDDATDVVPLADHDSRVPFVTISIGDEPIETARHGHRRGWQSSHGPWLGIGRAGGLDIISTCHMVVDGYGHTWLAARIAEHTRRLLPSVAPQPALDPPRLAPVANAIPLGIAWRAIEGSGPRALPMAYALGKLLHQIGGRPHARFSPTLQIPVTLGSPDDPQRRLRRNVPAIASVRFERGMPEPFEAFAERTRALLRREGAGDGLTSRLLAAVRGMPAPLSWKRQAVGSRRPRWLDPIADVIAGRACLSRIRVESPAPPSVAVSSPSRLATSTDPLGGCVVTLIDDGTRGAITVCGSGLAGTGPQAEALIDQILDGIVH